MSIIWGWGRGQAVPFLDFNQAERCTPSAMQVKSY